MPTAHRISKGARGAIGRCRRCATVLPLRWPADNETPQEWVCASCGEAYSGVRIQNLPREYAANALPAGSLVRGPIAGEADSQIVSFLHPTRANDGLPHPITIAFPDRPRIICRVENSFSRSIDDRIVRGAALELPPQQSPFAGNLRDLGCQPYDAEWVRRVYEQIVLSTNQVRDQFAAFRDGRIADVRVFQAINEDQLRLIVEDRDVFSCLGIRAHQGDYPSRHALQVSMLAKSMGVAMGWDEPTLRDLGMGCLIHEAGMLRVAGAKFEKRAILSAEDYSELAMHAVSGLELFEQQSGEISERALVVAYQIHERCNGMGYPRGYTAERMHPLARVAAIADVFVALQAPRPHRPGMVPYHAIKKIMHDTERGLFDKEAFRALLDTVSVFPIGSFVALNDGRVGRVIRPNTGLYDRPIVEAWRRGETNTRPVVINLSEPTGVAIASSLARLEN